MRAASAARSPRAAWTQRASTLPARRLARTPPSWSNANQGYDRAQAVEFGRLVGDVGIRWFEEPCRWTNDRRWMRDVRYQTGIPVCAGQSETTLHGIRDLIAEGSIDVSNFDASWAGGPTVWRKAAGVAAAFGVELGHHEEPQFSSHLLASVPDHTFVECFDEERDPFFWRLTDMSSRIRIAATACPNAPASASSSTGGTWTRTPSIGASPIAGPRAEDARREPRPGRSGDASGCPRGEGPAAPGLPWTLPHHDERRSHRCWRCCRGRRRSR